jgi:hypothetical protein
LPPGALGNLATGGCRMPHVHGERKVIETHAEPGCPAGCRHRLALLIGGQLAEHLIEVLAPDRFEALVPRRCRSSWLSSLPSRRRG